MRSPRPSCAPDASSSSPSPSAPRNGSPRATAPPVSTTAALSRRGFLHAATIAGVTVWVAPLASKAYAALFEEQVLAAVPRDTASGQPLFRMDGVSKVTGAKVFARDIRAKDMPHWPQQQSHAFILRTTLADRSYAGLDLSHLDGDLKPDRVVTAEDLAKDGLAFPTFYGDDMLLPVGKTPAYLGQVVAILIYHDFERFRLGKERAQAIPGVIRYGDKTPPLEREPWGVFRYVRQGGASSADQDVFSSLRDNALFPSARKPLVWPRISEADAVTARGLEAADSIARELATPPADWLVLKRHYATQSIDTAAMEPDNANCWYDPATKSLHLVLATQSPHEVAEWGAQMVKASQFPLEQMFVHPCYTVGYGSKDHASMPYYGLVCALYGDGKPVRLANNRFENFQSSLKRHAFEIDYTLAVDKKTGKFQTFVGYMTANGGGRANFSPSVAMVGATAAQSIYYFPKNDLTAVALATRALDAGSARGYGTLQSMAATEMMVDEVAQLLNVDPIELRLTNALRSGEKNTQGAIAGGAIRVDEVLERARRHPMWTGRAQRKTEYEAAHPNERFGVGFACVQKDFGTGGEAHFARVEVTREGRVLLAISGTEIGTGIGTSQAQNCAQWFGKPADATQTSAMHWPELPMLADGDTYLMTQAQQDQSLASKPLWTAVYASPSSASNSAFFSSHATNETARVVFEHGLWPAAVAIWSTGEGGGQWAPFTVRMEQARWVNGMLTAGGMQPLSLQTIARKAHELGLVTGATGHAFNRWQWAQADFDVKGLTMRRALDGLAVQYGAGEQGSGKGDVQAQDPTTHASAPVTGPDSADAPVVTLPESESSARRSAADWSMIPRSNVMYPPTQRNNAGVTYYSANAAIVELAVDTRTGEVKVLAHHHVMECGKAIVKELVAGQLEGGIAMGIGHALYEFLPLYEGGPGDGNWNFHRYHLPRGNEVAVWKQTHELLPPLSDTDPPKGIAEVVMIPIVGAIVNGIHQAIGKRFYDLPVTPQKIREALAS